MQIATNSINLENSEFMGLPSEDLSFNPWPHSPHMKIVNLVKNGALCLDVGCASGYIARELSKKKCITYCIEILNADIEKN